MEQKPFDPDGVGVDNGTYFGLPFDPQTAELVLISAPWDVTVSYGAGTAYAPDAIIEASTQLDFYDPLAPGAWRRGIATADVDYSLQESSQRLRSDASRVIDHLEGGGCLEDDYVVRKVRRVNEGCVAMNANIESQAARWLDAGKVVGLVGGDHSTPYGLIRALGARRERFGILHIDAHCDLRDAYEGFEFSHASIIATFDDLSLAAAEFRGETWDAQCRRIVDTLPAEVYVSFDIDGLSFDNCPHTGTPVCGGLSFNKAVYLIDTLVRSGRRIIGFDVVEVCPAVDDRIDAITGARILWKLCGQTLKSNEKPNND